MKIPFRRKSARSNKEEDTDTNKDIDTNKIYSQPNETVKSNISNSVKNSYPMKTETNYQVCIVCKNLISGEFKKPEWKWNLDTTQPMCNQCYERKSKEYEKINNYCYECNKKLGFIRYNPKPLWCISGHLCRSCWDIKNSTFKK